MTWLDTLYFSAIEHEKEHVWVARFLTSSFHFPSVDTYYVSPLQNHQNRNWVGNSLMLVLWERTKKQFRPVSSRNPLEADLILEPVYPGADRHGLDVALPVDAVVVAARLAQCLVEPPLKLLESKSRSSHSADQILRRFNLISTLDSRNVNYY